MNVETFDLEEERLKENSNQNGNKTSNKTEALLKISTLYF